MVIYLAGHGEAIDGKWYFIPSDIPYPLRKDSLVARSVSFDEMSALLVKIKAQKVVLLIDSCKSGAALSDVRNFDARKEWTVMARQTGVHVIAAASKDQSAIELPQLGHGAFTYLLLKGLEGSATKGGYGSQIGVVSLAEYVRQTLPDLSRQYNDGIPQVPVVYSRGSDFPLSARSR
ncbi:hypothetical protein WCLP8_5380006 [uncultured Gammaproteobacteria bacterium]